MDSTTYFAYAIPYKIIRNEIAPNTLWSFDNTSFEETMNAYMINK